MVTREEVWERFRAAARALVAEGGGVSDLVLVPPAGPSAEPRVPQEQLITAFRAMLARLGDRASEFFPEPDPGPARDPRGEEMDQLR